MIKKYRFLKLPLFISAVLLISWSHAAHKGFCNFNTSSVIKDTSICDKMFGGKFLEGSQITLLDLGGAYPNQKITVVIKGADRNKFKTPPETLYVGKTICVKGPVQIYKGRPEIVVTDPQQIVLQ